MLSTLREVLKETIITLVLIQLAIFLVGSLVPRSIRKTFKLSTKGVYKLIRFIFTKLKKLVVYSLSLYKKQKENRLQKQPVSSENVIDINPYLKKAK